ncbi:hypothetical protein RB195_006054 [Necator americanus]|uniref:Uncharacterized protein n=1 Tax=Necator americanus TaxID=51031 RepID=A0ABR1BTT1_NECAM
MTFILGTGGQFEGVRHESTRTFRPSSSSRIVEILRDFLQQTDTPSSGTSTSSFLHIHMNSTAAPAMRVVLLIFTTMVVVSSAPSRQKRAFDSFAGSFSGLDKRAFDSLAAPGFDAFNKRAFDTLAGQGFEAFNKRAFDSLSGSGLTPFNKRAFDSLAGNGFGGFDKRSPLDGAMLFFIIRIIVLVMLYLPDIKNYPERETNSVDQHKRISDVYALIPVTYKRCGSPTVVPLVVTNEDACASMVKIHKGRIDTGPSIFFVRSDVFLLTIHDITSGYDYGSNASNVR